MKANQKFMKADEAVSPVIGVILMVAITVVLAAVVFVLVSDLGDTGDQTPQITLTKNNAGDSAVLTVQNAPPNLNWADFEGKVSVDAGKTCTSSVPTAGTIAAGDTIRFTAGTLGDCIGAQFSLVHEPTNGVAARSTL